MGIPVCAHASTAYDAENDDLVCEPRTIENNTPERPITKRFQELREWLRHPGNENFPCPAGLSRRDDTYARCHSSQEILATACFQRVQDSGRRSYPHASNA